MSRLIEHKPTAECQVTAPHDEAICGIVAGRHRRSAEMNAAIERQLEAERERAAMRAAGGPRG
ncbi:MAG TPA: hypothetical protein VFK09_10595 [Gemmatimonadales bacterium]|jgi:hypothetical protein|nr:hypothetical protein [Gemmatimonadales bacterium]